MIDGIRVDGLFVSEQDVARLQDLAQQVIAYRSILVAGGMADDAADDLSVSFGNMVNASRFYPDLQVDSNDDEER